MTDDMNSIKDIIRGDQAQLKRLGIDSGLAADKLESILESAKEGLESPVRLGGLTVRAQWDRGLIPCMMGEPGLFPKIAVELVLPSGKVVQYSSLSIHLIRAHGYFGEPGRLFRVEPEDIAALLE